ncbi:MAG: hypothetical protein H7246_06060 [Phycisphaerae bacterium]|nr:hypothetical protein [Saprospiraceae bacterium]
MAYLQETNGEWYALPFSRSTQNYFFWAKTGAVRIHSQNDGASPIKFAGKVRVVAVTSEGMLHNLDLDWTDYEAVNNRLQLPE